MNTEAILGSSGTGKSFNLRERITADPQYALLTSSTGISAVNLGDGVTTIHSALGFFDLRSLQEANRRGAIKRKAIELATRGKKNLVLDEVSMFSAESFQLVHDGFMAAAREREDDGLASCGLLVTGDFLQLSPVPDDPKQPVKYAFEAPCWAAYEANMTRLTKIYRQDNAEFLAALQLARQGRGVDAAIALKKCGVEFAPCEDEQFDGITLFPVNAQVDSYNERRLAALPGDVVEIPSKRWGKERGEWRNISDKLQLKDGALVMVLVNQSGTFQYVNGDLATWHFVYDAPPTDGSTQWQNHVETKRGYVGPIPFTTRRNISYAPEHSREDCFNTSDHGKRLNSIEDNEGRSKRWIAIYLDYVATKTMRGECYYDPKEKGTVIGEIEYMPLRLAYASSYNKTQGLTLDKVQISLNHFFAGKPGMQYVAMSRVRNAEGLRIIGDVAALSRKIKTDPKVMRWV